MKKQTTSQGWSFQSPYLALAVRKTAPQIGFLNIESGGRSRQHLDKNLLRPGFGGEILPDQELNFSGEQETSLNYANNTITGHITCPDDRSFKLVFHTGETLTGTLFRVAFAPNIAPPSLWAKPCHWDRLPDPLDADPFDPPSFLRDFHPPGLISLPEYGLLRCESSTPNLKIRETLNPDAANIGMNLGLKNLGGHNNRRAFHHGRFEFSFELTEPVTDVELTFTVIPEIYPQIPGCDLDAPQWDGFKRHWMSNFTLNPPTLSLGDNPILHGLGHLAIHWKSDLSVLTPELLPGISLHEFFKQALELTFTQHTAANGQMTGYGWENGACNLIALHAYLVGTGDWAFARKYLPTIQKVIEYNLALDQDNDGLLEAAYHGNHFRDEKTSLNWWDAFSFGHKDAYGNLVYYEAFRRSLPILERLDQPDIVTRLEDFLTKFRANFHSTFFNPETGVYAGWISRDGRVHDYMFTFISAMAINAGLVVDSQGREMMQRLLDQLVESGYGDFKYGVPGPAIPVHPDDRSDWGPMADWGQYENGGFCGQTAYHFILALYRVGLREQADKILFNMLETFENLPTQSGLTTRFTESWDWRTKDGRPCGYNYLADNYVFLLAAIQGHFGIDLPKLA
jgi:hypothetical protein